MRSTLSSLLSLLLMSTLLGGLLRAPCGVAMTPPSSHLSTAATTPAQAPCPMHGVERAHLAADVSRDVLPQSCDHSGSGICHCQAASLALLDVTPVGLPALRPQGIRPRLQTFVVPRVVERRLRPPIAQA